MRFRFLAFLAFLFLASSSAFAQTTYTWNGTTTDFQVSTNWNPTRTTPAVDDILVFDGAVTAGSVTVTNIPTVQQIIGKLILQNNATITLESGGAAPATGNLRPSAAAADVLQVSSGSSLIFGGANGIIIRPGTGSTATINGLVRFTSTAAVAGVAHRLIANSALGIQFASGSSFEFAARGTGWGNPFSNVVSVQFLSGSSFYQGGTATAVSEGTGSNPFNTATACMVCDPGSLFYNWTSVYSTAARTYGNLTVDNRGAAVSAFGVTALVLPTVIDGNLLYKSTSVGAVRIALAAAPNNPAMQIKGNWTVESGGTFGDLYADAAVNNVEIGGNVSLLGVGVAINQTSGRTFVLNGTSNQSIQIVDGQHLYGLTVDNGGNGATVTGNLGIRGVLALTNGNLTTSGVGNSVILYNAATVSGAGLILGNVTRLLDASVLGTSTLPIADTPVSFEVTGAGTGSGSITGSTTGSAGAGLPAFHTGINRTWTLTSATISGYTATLVFTYKDSDLGSATESALQAARFNGSTWDVLPSTVNTVANTVTVTGVTALSEWTLLQPPAPGVADWNQITD